MSESSAASTTVLEQATCLPPHTRNQMSPPPTNATMSTTPCPNSTPPPSAQLRDVLSQPPSSHTSTRRHTPQRPSRASTPSIASQRPSQVPPSQKPRVSTSKQAPNFRKPQPFVTIKTDKAPDQSTFVIHKTLLEHNSSFFLHAFSGDFKEAKTQTMVMDDVPCSVFGLLVHWLYTTTIEFEPDDDESSQITLLAGLWTLAEIANIKSLQNEVMAMLHPRKLGVVVYTSKVPMNKNLLKKMLVEKVALGSSDKELLGWMQSGGIPEGMVIDVMMTLKKGNKGDLEPSLAVERYFL